MLNVIAANPTIWERVEVGNYAIVFALPKVFL